MSDESDEFKDCEDHDDVDQFFDQPEIDSPKQEPSKSPQCC